MAMQFKRAGEAHMRTVPRQCLIFIMPATQTAIMNTVLDLAKDFELPSNSTLGRLKFCIEVIWVQCWRHRWRELLFGPGVNIYAGVDSTCGKEF